MDEPSQNPVFPQEGVVAAGGPPTIPESTGAPGAASQNPQDFLNPPPASPPETFVVPPMGAVTGETFKPLENMPSGTSPSTFQPEPQVSLPANPFIPQGVAATGQTSAPNMPKSAGGSGIKKIFLIFFLIVLFVGFGVGGWLLFKRFTGPKEVTISYWGLWEDETIINSAIAEFEDKNPKIKVKYQKNSHRQYRERLQAAIGRDEGPDVFRFHNTWIAMLKNEIGTAPEGFISSGDFNAAFYPVASADLVAGQTIFGLPLMIDGLGLYYNEDLFATAGVNPPATWEDILSLVPKLTVKDDQGKITTSAIALGTTGNVEHFSDILAVMMMQNGVKLTQPIGQEAEETLIFYHKFADSSDPVYTWDETLDNSVYAFATGRVAMILAPSWRAFEISELAKNNNVNLHFKISAIPQLPGSSVTWASYWVEGVSAKSKYPIQAWEFIKFLTSKETATKLYTEAAKTRLFGEPYARVDLASTLENDPYVGAYIKQAKIAKSFPLASRTFDNGINDQLIKYLEDAVNGFAQGSAPAAVLETAATGFQKVLSKYGLTSASAPSAP